MDAQGLDALALIETFSPSDNLQSLLSREIENDDPPSSENLRTKGRNSFEH
jgi:hypothetical protein